MRKTLNINLGGMAFIIDENAFELLHTYLEALKRKFNNEAERAEIMNDIEARIAELLSQRLQNRKEVIGIDDVQFVTDAMGKPEDIAGEETETTSAGAQNASTFTAGADATGTPIKKRLFRDPDDAKISGVISGMCHYFGIADPVWARIIALVLIFFTSGAIIPIYILLLIIIPKAQTAAEKLQMKGEPVNINTIEKEIKDAAGRAGESVHKFVTEQNIFERLWDALLSILKALAKVFAVFDIIFAMIFLAAVVVCFFAFYILGSTQYNEASRIIVDSGSVIRFFSFGFLLFLATPLIALIYLGLKILLGQRSRVRWLKWGLFGGWVIGLIFLGISSFKVLTHFAVSGTSQVESPLAQPARGALYVQITDTTGRKLSKSWMDNENQSIDMAHGQIMINGVDLSEIDRLPIGRPMFELMPSENDSFYIQEVFTAQGSNKNDAVKNANMVIYTYSQADTVLNLSSNLYIHKTDKWRSQRMKLRIAIPAGKQIRFADNMDLWSATVKGDANYDDTYFANTTWTVENGKVKCIEGENHKNVAKENRTDDKVEQKLKKIEDKLDKLDKKNDKATHKDDDDDKDEKDEKDQDF